MANKKNLKKDVDFLVSEVVSDCYTFMLINGDKNHDKALAIIETMLEKRNELITRINNPENKHDAKAVKAHYKAIQEDLMVAVDDSFTKLSAITK
ncbi:MAG: hypothetical protein F9K37_13015 [Bacteroidales bacterium]|nr:MAG: hypothetical protein F9K37_13015 [Bacteroidales bacterium]